MPARTGKRNDGTEWIDLSFVCAYYENGEQRYEDSALVSTFDTNIIAKLAPYVAKDQNGKAIIENDCARLLVAHIPCTCGFSLKAKVVAKKDGSGFAVIQENRCYKLDVSVAQQQTPQPQVQQMNVLGGPQTPPYNPYAPQPFPPQVDANGNPQNQEGGKADDLPF